MANLTGNNITSSNQMQRFTIQYIYIGFATPAVVANLIILYTVCRSYKFLKKSAFITGLAFSDTLLASGVIVAGTVQILSAKHIIAGVVVEPIFCLQQMTTLLLLGYQLPSAMVLLIGAERFVAIVFFKWYYINWTNKKAWFLTLMTCLFCIVSVACCWIIVATSRTYGSVSIMCATIKVSGKLYSFHHFGFGIFCGILAIFFTVVSLLTFWRKKMSNTVNNSVSNVRIKKFVRKQWNITLAMTCVAFFDFTLLVVPNIFIVLDTVVPSAHVFATHATSMLCIKATVNIFVYIAVYSEFRDYLVQGFSCKMKAQTLRSVHCYESEITRL